MKQVKKLLVILPLVALFVLGSLPVLAEVAGEEEQATIQLTLVPLDPKKGSDSVSFEMARKDLLPGATLTADQVAGSYETIYANLKSAIEKRIQNSTSWEIEQNDLKTAAWDLSAWIRNSKNKHLATVAVKMKSPAPTPAPVVRTISVEYYEDEACTRKYPDEDTRTYTLPTEYFADGTGKALEYNYNNVSALAGNIRTFVERQLQGRFVEAQNSFTSAAERFLQGNNDATVRMYVRAQENVDERVRVIAYDIHNNKFVYDRLYKLNVRPGFWSPRDISQAFYDNSDQLKDDYLYAGFATRNVSPVLVYSFTYLEQTVNVNYIEQLNARDAQIITFVVPKTIPVRVEHIFPAGTRDKLIETVDVPYITWAALQSSHEFMDLPAIFKTRIQKVNEQGFVYKEVKYFNGSKEISGLLSAFDWIDIELPLRRDPVCARIYYDVAVAAAKEVPTEKKVDAASAPQAQINAPAAGQAQAPVTAANNATTTTAPANTLPVTGASDSIFLFLSSAALMAVGILFFKKH